MFFDPEFKAVGESRAGEQAVGEQSSGSSEQTPSDSISRRKKIVQQIPFRSMPFRGNVSLRAPRRHSTFPGFSSRRQFACLTAIPGTFSDKAENWLRTRSAGLHDSVAIVRGFNSLRRTTVPE
jgi:hypothetical protein